MANLIPRKSQAEPFPAFDETQRARFEERARSLFGLRYEDRAREFDLLRETFSAELEELDSVPSLEVAHDLLDQIDRVRRTSLEPGGRRPVDSAAGAGAWMCYWPGRSMETGEAEIASRGFFDGLDRPPLGLWLEAMARRDRTRSETFELAILCWIPASEVVRARAGREACVAGTLAFLDEVSDALTTQLSALGRPTQPPD